MEIVWKDLAGYEGKYWVSSDGQVKSRNKILRQWKTRAGYLSISTGDQKNHAVHRLVAAAFIGPCPKGQEVNHRDGVKTNNIAENLEYMTRAENIRHAVKNGLIKLGEERAQSKLTEEKIRFAYALVRGGATRAYAARRIGCPAETISDVFRGQTWVHLGLPKLPGKGGYPGPLPPRFRYA